MAQSWHAAFTSSTTAESDSKTGQLGLSEFPIKPKAAGSVSMLVGQVKQKQTKIAGAIGFAVSGFMTCEKGGNDPLRVQGAVEGSDNSHVPLDYTWTGSKVAGKTTVPGKGEVSKNFFKLDSDLRVSGLYGPNTVEIMRFNDGLNSSSSMPIPTKGSTINDMQTTTSTGVSKKEAKPGLEATQWVSTSAKSYSLGASRPESSFETATHIAKSHQEQHSLFVAQLVLKQDEVLELVLKQAAAPSHVPGHKFSNCALDKLRKFLGAIADDALRLSTATDTLGETALPLVSEDTKGKLVTLATDLRAALDQDSAVVAAVKRVVVNGTASIDGVVCTKTGILLNPNPRKLLVDQTLKDLTETMEYTCPPRVAGKQLVCSAFVPLVRYEKNASGGMKGVVEITVAVRFGCISTDEQDVLHPEAAFVATGKIVSSNFAWMLGISTIEALSLIVQTGMISNAPGMLEGPLRLQPMQSSFPSSTDCWLDFTADWYHAVTSLGLPVDSDFVDEYMTQGHPSGRGNVITPIVTTAGPLDFNSAAADPMSRVRTLDSNPAEPCRTPECVPRPLCPRPRAARFCPLRPLTCPCALWHVLSTSASSI